MSALAAEDALVISAPQQRDMGRRAIVKDSEGHIIELSQRDT